MVEVELTAQSQVKMADQAVALVIALQMALEDQQPLVKVMMVVIVVQLTVELVTLLLVEAALVRQVQTEMMVEVMEVTVLPTVSQEVL